MTNTLRTILTLTLALGACAEVPDADEPEFPELQAASRCRPNMWCNAQRAPEGLVEITRKRNELSDSMRERYFATALGDVGTTPDAAAHFQWFEGSEGRGAIYNVHNPPVDQPGGAFYIYGAILEEWARGGYERGLGYFTDPSHSGGTTEQLFEIEMEFIPSIANQGLLRTRARLVAHPDGRIERRSRNEYLNSSDPSQVSLSPQPCEIHASRSIYGDFVVYPEVPLDGYTGAPLEDGYYPILWCGTRPPEDIGDVPDV